MNERKAVCPNCGNEIFWLLTVASEVYVSEDGSTIRFKAMDAPANMEAGLKCFECDEPRDGFEGTWEATARHTKEWRQLVEESYERDSRTLPEDVMDSTNMSGRLKDAVKGKTPTHLIIMVGDEQTERKYALTQFPGEPHQGVFYVVPYAITPVSVDMFINSLALFTKQDIHYRFNTSRRFVTALAARR